MHRGSSPRARVFASRLCPSLAPSLTNLIIHDDVFRPSFLPFIQELYQLTQLTVLSKSSRFGLPGAPSWGTYGNNLELKWPSDTSLSSFSFPSTLKRTWMNVAIPSNVMRTLPRNLEFLYSCIPSLHALVEARTLVPNALIGSLITVAITGAESLQLLIDRAPFTDLQHLSSSLLSALTSKTWFQLDLRSLFQQRMDGLMETLARTTFVSLRSGSRPSSIFTLPPR